MMKEELTLNGRTVLLTRAQKQQDESRILFESSGARVLDFPTLIITPPDEWTSLDNALENLDSFHWIIFSSANGIEAVQKRLQVKNMNISMLPKTLKIAVVGRKTSNILEKFGIKPDFIPPDFVADSLIDHFPNSVQGLRILLPRVQSGGRTIMAKSFNKKGAYVTEVPAYNSICPKDIPEKTREALENFKVDAITFTSGKTVSNSFRLIQEYFPKQWKEKINGIKLVSIGPQTTLKCKKYFMRVDKEANPHTMEGLLKACIDVFNVK